MRGLSLLHSDPGFPAVLGDRVSVGHRAIIHGATVEDDALVGMGATLLNGVRVGSGSVVAAGAVVAPKTKIPPNSLAAGVPAKVVREARDSDHAMISHTHESYLRKSSIHEKVEEITPRRSDPSRGGMTHSGCDRLPGVEGTTIREARPEDAPSVARVHVDAWRATYPGIVPDEFLKKMSCEESESRWREWLGENGNFFFVAASSGEVVGFASGGTCREEAHPEYEGELYTIYLSSNAQGAGTGRALLRAVARGLTAEGFRSMLAWVMAENRPARRFHEAAGGRLLGGSGTFELAGESIEEVAYGWMDLRTLVEPTERT